MLLNKLVSFSKPNAEHFVVEGRWGVEALLESRLFQVVSVLRAEGSHLDFDQKYGCLSEVLVCPKSELSSLMGFSFHRGILALVKRPVPNPLPFAELDGLLVACPELADESNLGAIIRTAAALGASGILLPQGHGADVYSRKSIRASSGAVFRVPIFECADLALEVLQMKEYGFTVLATSCGVDSFPLNAAPEVKKGVVLFGAENGGLSQQWHDLSDVKLAIPMANGMDSLNVAACAAIVLYELAFGRRIC